MSVAIPAYNAQATIAQTLDSVLAQTHRNLDIVVVDDGSTDGTWEVLQRYEGRIRAIRQINSGIGVARNVSVQAARGEFIALLDADDLCAPNRLSIQLRYLRAHPNILLCSSDFGAFDANGPLAQSYCGEYYHRCSPALGGVQARYPHVESFQWRADEAVRVYWGQVYGELVQGNFIHPPTVMFRREALQRAGFFDPDIRIVCEWEWFVRVARVGPVAHLDLPLLDYRRSPTQISSNPRTALDSFAVARKIYALDPELARRAPALARKRLGQLSLSAADAMARVDAWQALRIWLASWARYRKLNMRTLRVLAKILLPAVVQDAMRREPRS
ncbi:MAG: glycosyltransferase [Thiomonas sp.]